MRMERERDFDARHVRALDELSGAIGNTPLRRLQAVTRDLPREVELHVKVEWLNPGGSIKDRPAIRMVREGIRSGAFTRKQTLMDATSGNTGIAYALIGATLGFRVRLFVPANLGPERRRILEAYGAELVLTDPLEGSDGALREARLAHESDPQALFYPDQYNNAANWKAHYDTTGPEIWRQTAGRITHFVAGLGTTGTFTGVGRFLKEMNPAIRLVALQPDSPFHGLDGIKHMGSAVVPGIYDPALPDEQRTVSTEEAYRMIGRLAREEGLLAGVSAAGAVVIALEVARQLSSGLVVTVLPDSATRYLGERFWQYLDLPVSGAALA